MPAIKNQAGFAEHAAPEAIQAALVKARRAAADAEREVRWLEGLLERRKAEEFARAAAETAAAAGVAAALEGQ